MRATHRALDHAFRLSGTGPGRDLVERILETFRQPMGGEPDAVYQFDIEGGQGVLRWDASEVFRGSASSAASQLLTTINVAAIRSVDRYLVIHAAAVAFGGAGIVIPAHPGAGKSTLCSALVADGFAYITDEAAPIIDSKEVIPYQKPIVVGRGSFETLAHVSFAALAEVDSEFWFLDPGTMMGGLVEGHVPIKYVVVPHYAPDALLNVTRLTPGEIAAALASNAFNIGRHGRAGIETCASVALEVVGVRIIHGGAMQAVAAIAELVLQ